MILVKNYLLIFYHMEEHFLDALIEGNEGPSSSGREEQ